MAGRSHNEPTQTGGEREGQTKVRDLAESQVNSGPQANGAEEDNQPLSEREIEILGLAQRGLSNPQIAHELQIHPGTVRKHLSNVYRKLRSDGRHEALQMATELGLI